MVGNPQDHFNEPKKDGVLDQNTIEEMTPAPDYLYIPLSECITGLIYVDDGSSAPDEEIHYSIKLDMGNQRNYNEILQHPDGQEIYNTITSYMSEHGYDSLVLELDRDLNQLGTYDKSEVGPNSLTPGTIGDLDVILEDLVPMLNETYGLHIQSATTNASAQQVEGCSASSWFIPGNVAETIKPDGDIKHDDNTAGLDTYKPM